MSKEWSRKNACCCFHTCWFLPQRGRKAPLNVCVVVGRRGNRGNTRKGKEREILKNKKTPKKKILVGKIISTQPYSHNSPRGRDSFL